MLVSGMYVLELSLLPSSSLNQQEVRSEQGTNPGTSTCEVGILTSLSAKLTAYPILGILRIYLFMRERDLPSAVVFPQRTQSQVWAKPKSGTENSIWVSKEGGSGPNTRAILYQLPKFISRELDLKWDFNWHPNMECQCCRQLFHVLSHKAGLIVFFFPMMRELKVNKRCLETNVLQHSLAVA